MAIGRRKPGEPIYQRRHIIALALAVEDLMRKKVKKRESEAQRIRKRLEALSYSRLCDEGCYGRCRDCPAEAVEDAIVYLRTLGNVKETP